MQIKKYMNFIKEKIDLVRYIVLKMLDMGVTFLLTLMLVRKLTGYEYGIYSLIITILGMLVTFGFSWTSSSLMYFGVEERLKFGSLNRTFWARNVILAVSYCITLMLLIIFHKKLDSYLTVSVSFYIFGWMSIKILSDYISSYFLAIEKRGIAVLVSLTIKVLTLIFLIFIPMTLKKILLVSIFSELTSLCWLVKAEKKDFGKFIFDPVIFKEILSFGLWQLFGFSGLYLINFGDNLVIKHFLTMEDVGIYNVAYQLYFGMAAFSFLFGNYFAPQVVKAIRNKDIVKLNDIYIKDRFILVLLVLLPHLGVIFLSKCILVSFYGVTYISAVKPLIVLTIGSLCEYITVFNMLTFNCFKKYYILQILNVIQAILNIVLDIIFVSRFGIVGAAYGTVFSFFIVALLKTYFAEKLLKNFKERILLEEEKKYI